MSDNETAAISQCVQILSGFNEYQRSRILNYLNTRYLEDSIYALAIEAMEKIAALEKDK